MKNTAITVVLVHGAWADGSSWGKVITQLRARDVKVIASPQPLTTFDDDVQALNRAISRTVGPVLLAGHAYAGSVIAAAAPARVMALVYVAALAPDEGETVADVFYRNEPHPQAPKLAPDTDGLIWLAEDAFASAFAQHATEPERAVLMAAQRPISPACITVKVGKPLWKSVPTSYLVAQEDRMIVEPTQKFMALRMQARIVRTAADHVPMVTAPDTVTETILQAIAQL